MHSARWLVKKLDSAGFTTSLTSAGASSHQSSEILAKNTPFNVIEEPGSAA